MADIALSDLSNIGTNAAGQPDILDADLFLAQHNDAAVNVTGAQIKAFIDRNVLSVTVTYIAPTATGTASYDPLTGALTLGIPKGNGIASIANTATAGAVDTYTITYQDGNTTTFDVTNGSNIDTITKTGSATVGGRVVDTYTITLTNGNTTTFQVTNGKDGTGTVNKVMNVSPDGNNNIPASSIFNLIYPVGFYIWTSDGDFDPNGTFAGVWTKITDKVLVAKGTTYTGTGGVSSNTVDFSNGTAKIGWNDAYGNPHTDGVYMTVDTGKTFTAQHRFTATSGSIGWADPSASPWTVDGIYPTMLQGSQVLDNNMPYVAAYCWHRDS